MEKLAPHWEILRRHGIEAPCRVYLSGSFKVLVLGSTRSRKGAIGKPLEDPERAYATAAGLQSLSIRGFKELNLSGIGMFSHLKLLMLNQNQLATLPTEIGQLRQLRKLSLFERKLQELPDSFFTLPLKQNWLGSNQLPAATRARLRRTFAKAFRFDSGLKRKAP